MTKRLLTLAFATTLGCTGAGSADESGCEAGSGVACFNAALAVQKAGGDPARVDALYQQGCDLGNPDACSNLAVLLQQEGGIIPADATRARQLNQRACKDLEHARGCNDLAVAELNGIGGAKDLKAAKRNFGTACRGDLQLGCFNLGVAYGQAKFGDAEFNMPEALRFLQKACDLDHGEACFFASDILQKGQGGPADPEKALVLAQKACKLGVNEACAAPTP